MKNRYFLAAALILLSLVSLSFGAVSVDDSVEERSPILYYNGVWDEEEFYFYADYIVPRNFSVLYFDLKNNISTESIAIEGMHPDADYNQVLNAPGHVDITYSTSPALQKFEYNWTTFVIENEGTDWEYEYIYSAAFPVLGFFGEPYVALSNKTVYSDYYYETQPYKANKIAPLVMNDDERYTLKVGDDIDLGRGYTLYVDQVDVGGNKTNLILKHDDVELGSGIVNASESGNWIFETNILNEQGVQVLRVHVKDTFQSVSGAAVEINGLWLVDYLNAIEVKSDVDYGKWNATTINSESLTYVAEDIVLSSNAVIPLGKDLFIRVQDGFEIPPADVDETYDSQNRYYLFKEHTAPGTYNIKSEVSFFGTVYTYSNFGAFYYDLDQNLATEILYTYPNPDKFEKESQSFMYLTTYIHTNYEYLPNTGLDDDENLLNSWDSGYDVMGYFGEKYVPLNVIDSKGFYIADSTKLDKFAPLVTDDDSKHTLTTKEWIELGRGYSLQVDQIDVKGNQVNLELYKDGVLVNSSIVTTNAGDGSGDWIYKDTIQNVKDVQLLRVHVKDVFQGNKDAVVEIDGIWLTDFKNVTDLKADDRVGLLKYDGLHSMDEFRYYFDTYANSAFKKLDAESVLIFYLANNLTLSDDMDLHIAEQIYLKIYEGGGNILHRSAVQPFALNPGGYRYQFYVVKEVGNLSSGGGDDGNGGGDGGGSGGSGGGDGSDCTDPETDGGESNAVPTMLGALALGLFLLVAILVAAYLYRRYRARKIQPPGASPE
ncbi:hypothetical protein MmiEs2_10900 [Methanimicrococcus stummii]|uniref:S-layer family duplication domain-containing protein n=1 Tax=Methanimicrococcus stummii TaxID=3028294 RepID=A0AA96VMI6_9EURY|nr:S-layer protein domain-containing protein [Methanimicrococcus sp. Es2]WNY28877.1 hypothetical protein MmiEs2_10900 [Methanimicrococcus sp. Es2]